MNRLKKLMAIIAIVILIGSAPVSAQTSDSSATTNTSSSTAMTSSTPGDGSTEKHSQYFWIGGIAFVILVFGIGYVVRSRNKKNDNPHLSGDSINNPASGI